jgi:hypothetical protein
MLKRAVRAMSITSNPIRLHCSICLVHYVEADLFDNGLISVHLIGCQVSVTT